MKFINIKELSTRTSLVKVLHSTNGMFDKNTYFCELAIVFFLITREFWKWILF